MSTETSSEAARFPVFVDRDGNRFIFPNLCFYQGKQVPWAYCRRVCMALGVEEEQNTFDVVPDSEGMLNFPRWVSQAGSKGFAHGSAEVWLISGPKFDQFELEAAA